jgi:hypothetical protein
MGQVYSVSLLALNNEMVKLKSTTSTLETAGRFRYAEHAENTGRDAEPQELIVRIRED